MLFSRRALLGATTALVAAPLLAGCGQSAATITAEIVTDLGTVQTALTDLSPALTTIPGITSSIANTVQGYFSQAVSVAKTVSTATAAAQGQTVIGQIETYVNDGLGLLSGFALPAGISTIVAALKVALPFVEAAAVSLTSASVGAEALNPGGPKALQTLANAKTILKAS